MKKQFVLVDCNNFYVSCERLFNPSLENKPVIVLSNNDGCVVARSQEAKKFNIKMGDPFFKIRQLCRDRGVVVYSSNYRIYGDISQRVMHILTAQAPEIEIYSIDEAFLAYPDAVDIVVHCKELRRIIKRWVGIPTSIGIAPTKTLAKVANDLAKKDRTHGVFDFRSPQLQQEVLQKCPVEDIWGIGRGLAARLHTLGVFTAADFRDLDPSLVRKKMGVVGERMLWELRGVSCLPLAEPAAKKSITCSRSFGKTITEASDLAEALASHVNTACVKLREQESLAQALCVFLEATLDAQAGTRTCLSTIVELPMPTSDTPQIICIAKKALKAIFRKGLSYKKCGIVLLDLISEHTVAPDLFKPAMDPARRHLMYTVDALNERFGKDSLFFGAMGIDPQWKMRSERRSRHSTTSWEELPVVLA